MPSEHIQADVARIALDRVDGFPFERFANAFYSSLVGASFVPLGGLKDGGADARDGMIFEDGTRAETYYQASTEASSAFGLSSMRRRSCPDQSIARPGGRSLLRRAGCQEDQRSMP